MDWMLPEGPSPQDWALVWLWAPGELEASLRVMSGPCQDSWPFFILDAPLDTRRVPPPGLFHTHRQGVLGASSLLVGGSRQWLPWNAWPWHLLHHLLAL